MMNMQNMTAAARKEENLAPLPRITVHAFCETQEFMGLMQSVAADRRMARAHVQVFPGGIPAAVQAYAQTMTPELLVLESLKDANALFADLMALAPVCSPHTKVVVVGHQNDIQLYRRLIAEGVSDYLVMPLTTGQVLNSFANIFAGSEQNALGHVVAFIGARGGAGSSVIAHNVAWHLAKEYEKNTVVVDLDIAFGTAALDYNVHATQSIIDALSSTDRIDPVFVDRLLTKCAEHLMLLASPASVEQVIDIRSETLEILLDTLRGSTPWTVLDLPSDWEPWTKTAFIQADAIIITATPDLVSLRNVKTMLDAAKSLRPNDEPPMVVMNQVGQQKRPEIPVDDFCEALSISPAAVIEFDPENFGTALNESKMLAEIAPGSKAAQAMRSIARRLLGEEVETKKASASPISRIFENIGRMFSFGSKKG
jgi:pilus assembly protein CpaE